MIIHRISPTIDVYVKGIGWMKAMFLLDYGDQTNSMWKGRVYETGRVINAYDDEVIIAANPADAEKDVIPDEWRLKAPAKKAGANKKA